jgi:hypothetical protein
VTRLLKRPVPYGDSPPGLEAIYTGEVASQPLQEAGDGRPFARTAGLDGRVVQRWSTWTWVFPHDWRQGQAGWRDPEVRLLNAMQARLDPLDEKTRRIRAHIGSLVPCDAGFPVTVDELLDAIGRGELREPSFHNGCWACGMWWETRTSQPCHDQSMEAIQGILTGYLAGESRAELGAKHPNARGFVDRAFEWLGPVGELTSLQRVMLERALLPFEFLAKRDAVFDDDFAQRVYDNCFGTGGRGAELDEEIAALAGLPRVSPEDHDDPDAIADPRKRELYTVWRRIAHGIHTLADCHHSAFRYVEGWVYGIGTGKVRIPTRKERTERERLARLLFGYAFGLDKWLLGKPMQFVLLDLGHVDLGLDPKNEILRVYAYLGEERTPLKEWLAACLWHNLTHNTVSESTGPNATKLPPGGDFTERARGAGISFREWMDAALLGGR